MFQNTFKSCEIYELVIVEIFDDGEELLETMKLSKKNWIIDMMMKFLTLKIL